jgi:hypothetical protein
MKELAYRIWCAIALFGILIAWIAYGLWCLLTGQPMQPIN